MKALDTSALIALIAGERAARQLLRRLRGSELVTTELNLLELSWCSHSMGESRRKERTVAIEALRRKLTVLPIEGSAVREATSALKALRKRAGTPLACAVMGALQASGCDEIFTDDPDSLAGKWRLKVTKLT